MFQIYNIGYIDTLNLRYTIKRDLLENNFFKRNLVFLINPVSNKIEQNKD
jgi:hypothetical protein